MKIKIFSQPVKNSRSLLRCIASAEKSTDAKRGVDKTANANRATRRRTDEMRVFPWSRDTNAHLLSLMLDMTRRVSALQDAVADMRQENKLNYRQLKRHVIKLGAIDSSTHSGAAERPANYDSPHRPIVQSGIGLSYSVL